MTDRAAPPEEPVTLRQIFAAVQALSADVRALTKAQELTRKALVNVATEQARIAQAQLDFGNDIGARVRETERRLDRYDDEATATVPNGA